MSQSSRQQFPLSDQPDHPGDSVSDEPARSSNSKYAIEIAKSEEFVTVDDVLLREVTEKTLAAELVARAEVSIAVVGNDVIRELHDRYLGKNTATDVLSFAFDSEDDTPGDPATANESASEPVAQKHIEGEVILSAEMALETASRFHWKPLDECILYLVHGLLHLVGYDDLTESDQKAMRTREKAILKFWNLTPQYADQPKSPFVSDDDVPVDPPRGADS